MSNIICIDELGICLRCKVKLVKVGEDIYPEFQCLNCGDAYFGVDDE